MTDPGLATKLNKLFGRDPRVLRPLGRRSWIDGTGRPSNRARAPVVESQESLALVGGQGVDASAEQRAPTRAEARDVVGRPDGARSRRPRPSRAGLTLIEILVVVAILGLIAGVVGVAVVNALGGAQRDTAEIQLRNLSEALDLYRIKYNRYPTTAEGLQALRSPPGGQPALIESLPKDPWGADYLYVSPGQHNPGKFDLQSKGADGIADTEDDVKNW